MALRTPSGLIALVGVVGLMVLALVAPLVWGDDAGRIDVAHMLEGSSPQHLLGTDNLGRDMLARTAVATRLSLILAILAVLVAAGIGVPLGALPAVLGARGGRVVAAVIEFWLAFPGLLLALFLGVVLGVGSHAAVLAIGIAGAPSFARLTQTLSASVSRSDYVAAARVLGLSRSRVLGRHVLPNIAEPIILNTTVAVGYALLAMSGLSFLGLGVQSPSYDWGRLMDEGLERIYVTPEAALGPCVAIVIAGLTFNGLGEALAGAASTRPAGRRRRPRRLTDASGVVVTAARADARYTEAGDIDVRGRNDGGVAGVEGEVTADTVLEVSGLTVTFPAGDGVVTPVRGISFSVAAGETVGIVGESASGKSLTALSLAGLVPYPGEVTADRLEFLGKDLRSLPAAERKRLLGTALAMVFQDPSTSLNPALRIGTQLAEVAEVHSGLRRPAALRLAVDRLRAVRISSPERRVKQYPHELSGGMRQRAMIGIGLMGRPRLIIADEPTSSLDVTVQHQIMRLLRQVRADTGTSCLIISHDITVVTELCDRVLVMYAGRIVEELDVATLRTAARHPYTRALLAAVPDMATDRDRPLSTIPGRPPDVGDVRTGCAFADRCDFATSRSRTEMPVLEAVDIGRGRVACWNPQDGPVAGVTVSTASVT